MNKIKIFTILLLLAAFNLNLTAQNAGDIDTTFNPNDIGFGNGDGFNSYVKTMVLQPDTKAIIGGEFTNYNNTLFSNTPNRIARLNSNGSLDTSFNIGTGFSALVNTLAYQPDGKIIVGGWFSHYNGTLVNRIVALRS